MSFADLRASRRNKDPESFVASSNDDVPQEAYPESQYGANGTKDGKAKPTTVFDQPAGLPATVEVRTSTVEGRGVYTRVPVQPGTILSSLRPRVAVLTTASLQFFCSHCCNPASDLGLKRCTRCRVVWYCGESCQNKDWLSHKLECQALQSWGHAAPSADLSVPSDAIRCLGRVLWAHQKRGAESELVKEWNMLQSHRTSLPTSAFESHTILAHSIIRYIGATSPADLAPYGLSSAAELVDLVSRFTTNAFTLTTFSLEPIGVCITPAFALVNHSCEPNAALVFPHSSQNIHQEPQMQLIAIRQIAAGEQIYTAYVDTTLPRQHRHATLQETYNFVCNCTLCRRIAKGDPRQSIWCPNSCGGMCPTPVEDCDIVRCIKCNAAVASTDVILDALRVGQEALDKAINLRLKDRAKSLQLTTNMIPILNSARLVPSCHPLLALTRLHQELLIDSFTSQLSQDLLNQTIQAAAGYTSGLSNIFDFGHPVRATALAELGKLLAVDEVTPSSNPQLGQYPPSGPQRLRLAYETLLKAREETFIGFGTSNEGGRMGQAIREILIRLEKELGVWTQGIRDAIKEQQAAAARK